MVTEATLHGVPVGVELNTVEETLTPELVAHALDILNDGWYLYQFSLEEPLVLPSVLENLGLGIRLRPAAG